MRLLTKDSPKFEVKPKAEAPLTLQKLLDPKPNHVYSLATSSPPGYMKL
jgi:hypothetical protein